MNNIASGLSVQALLDQGLQGALSTVKLAEEANRQDGKNKKDDKKKDDDCVSSDHALKTAAALDEIAELLSKEGGDSTPMTASGHGSVQTTATMTGAPIKKDHGHSRPAITDSPSGSLHPGEPQNGIKTLDVTQPMEGPAPKMAHEFVGDDPYGVKAAEGERRGPVASRTSAARAAEAVGGPPKSSIADKAKDVAHAAGEKAKDVASKARSFAASPTGQDVASKAKTVGKGVAAAGAAGAAAAGAKHMVDSARAAKLRNLAGKAGLGAAAAGGALMAGKAIKDKLDEKGQKKKAEETSPRVMDALTPTPPTGGPAGLLSSNESATNFTRSDAYKNRKSDAAHMVDGPVLSAGSDSTLNNALAHGDSGSKIGAAQQEAAKVLLDKFAQNKNIDAIFGLIAPRST